MRRRDDGRAAFGGGQSRWRGTRRSLSSPASLRRVLLRFLRGLRFLRVLTLRVLPRVPLRVLRRVLHRFLRVLRLLRVLTRRVLPRVLLRVLLRGIRGPSGLRSPHGLRGLGGGSRPGRWRSRNCRPPSGKGGSGGPVRLWCRSRRPPGEGPLRQRAGRTVPVLSGGGGRETRGLLTRGLSRPRGSGVGGQWAPR